MARRFQRRSEHGSDPGAGERCQSARNEPAVGLPILPSRSPARPRTPGRRPRPSGSAIDGLGRCICLAVWCSLAGIEGRAAEPPIKAADRLTIRMTDARQLTGSIVVEARDGSVLLEQDDGRYRLLEPGQIDAREPAATAEPAGARKLGEAILAELPAGFDLLITKHYLICFDTSRDYARWCGGIFERLHDAFGNYWTRAGLEVTDPARPLVVVIFADRRAYETHAAVDLGAAADRVAGYYNLLSNRITTYDLTGSDALAAARGRRPGATGMAILSSPAAAGLVSTLVHEATHQLAFNGGLHQRLAPVPLWVSEGIATFFETPDLTSPRGWRGVGEVNPPRLERFLAGQHRGLIETIVRDDEGFRNADTALDCYAAAWAVTHHLARTRKREFAGYLKVLAAKRPLAEDSPAERLADFRAAFGEPADLEEAVVLAAARLAARRR